MSKRKRVIEPCPGGKTPAKLIVRVVDHQGNPVNGVKVFAVPKEEQGPTQEKKTEPLYKHQKRINNSELDGVAHFGKEVPTGKYDVSVYGEQPPDDMKTEVTVLANEKRRNRRNPHTTLELHALLMILDADRDGKVDLEPLTATDHEEWTWGEDGEGAVVMAKTRAYEEDQDADERSKITFKWTGPANQQWNDLTTTLKVEPHDKLRIYSSKAWKENASNCVFDGTQEKLDLKQVGTAQNAFQENQQIDLWLEAKDFPSSPDGSDAEIKLSFNSKLGEGPSMSQTAKVRIAPWLMAGDYDSVERVYIGEFPAVEVGGKFMMNAGKKVLNTNLRQEVQDLISTPLSLVRPVLSSSGGYHRYVRDVMRFGTHSAPGKAGNPVALRGNQTVVDLRTRADMDCANNRIGVVVRPRSGEATNADCGGNLVLSPPVSGADGPTYPFGRIICSHTDTKDMGASWRTFFAAQQFQTPIIVDTSWLFVGHADEVVAFVPANSEDRPYRMLLASPRRAYRILGTIDLAQVAAIRDKQESEKLSADATHIVWNVLSAGSNPVDFRAREAAQGDMDARLQNGNGRLCFNRFQHNGAPVQRWIDQYLQSDAILAKNNGTMAEKIKTVFEAASEVAGDLENGCSINDVIDPLRDKEAIGDSEGPVFIQLAVQVMLDHIRQTLQEALNIKDGDVVEVPILYNPETGNMVNLLLVGKTCVVPKPYGPLMNGHDLFEQALTDDLAGTGLSIHFINEWHEYHLDKGEIHCGTNQCPTSEAAKGKEWWLHEPSQVD